MLVLVVGRQEEEERGSLTLSWPTPRQRKLVRMLRALQSRGEGEGEGEEDEHVDIESIVTGSRSGALHDLYTVCAPHRQWRCKWHRLMTGNCTLAR